ncbi:retrovirus-related pol polyprotein from transposon TNT 1-94 [Tanacetum coccineum]
MALDNNEVLSDTHYYSSSSLDNESRENKYDKLCKISLRIINKNKQLKAKNEVLKREACELKTKVEQLERNKEISLECESCVNLQSKISTLTLKLAGSKNSSSSLQEMLEMQKPPKDKYGLGYTEVIASTSSTKTKKLSPENTKMPYVEPASPVPSSREPASSVPSAREPTSPVPSVRLKVKLEPDEWIKDSGCSRHMTGNKDLFLSYKTIDGVQKIRMDHGREFDNEVQFGAFCDANGITYNFSALRTPQSNGIVERKNRTLQEMSRTMLNEQSIPQKNLCNAVDTSTYILNRILIRSFLGKTPYELFKGKKPSLEYFKVFGCKCFILNSKDYLTKFDPKSTEGIFLRYSPNSKAYIILNKVTMKVKESLNVKFDESPPPKSPPLEDDDILECEIIENKEKYLEIKENEPLNKEIINIKESKDHPLETIIEPKNVKEAIQDESWTMAMQEELNQFKTNNVWSLVHPLENQTIIGLESKVMMECCFVVEIDAWLRGELTLSSLDVLQGFRFFLQIGFTLILATLDGLDVGLLGDVIGEDDCDDDG